MTPLTNSVSSTSPTFWSRLTALPAQLAKMNHMIRDEYSPANLDAHLDSFRQYLLANPDRHHAMRSWKKASPAKVSPEQVVNISPQKFADVLYLAMEIEEPIRQYTRESGEGFSVVLPNLARFMGMTAAQAKYAEEHQGDWCQAVWCEEEKRHAPIFAKTIEKLTGVAPQRDNPTEVDVVSPDVEDALSHVIARMSTEWSASSAYAALASHATGELRGIMENVWRDEIKHLAIISAARTYIKGDTPWRRLAEMLGKVAEFGVYHRGTRTTGSTLTNDPIAMIETGAAFMMSEFYMQRWIHSLPRMTLRDIFEAESKLPKLPEASDEVQSQKLERMEDFESSDFFNQESNRKNDMELMKWSRLGMDRWPSRLRRREHDKRNYIDSYRSQYEGNSNVLLRYIDTHFFGFKGAEISGSQGDQNMRKLIHDTVRWGSQFLYKSDREKKMIEAIFIDFLRDYQIRNNHYALSQKERA